MWGVMAKKGPVCKEVLSVPYSLFRSISWVAKSTSCAFFSFFSFLSQTASVIIFNRFLSSRGGAVGAIEGYGDSVLVNGNALPRVAPSPLCCCTFYLLQLVCAVDAATDSTCVEKSQFGGFLTRVEEDLGGQGNGAVLQ